MSGIPSIGLSTGLWFTTLLALVCTITGLKPAVSPWVGLLLHRGQVPTLLRNVKIVLERPPKRGFRLTKRYQAAHRRITKTVLATARRYDLPGDYHLHVPGGYLHTVAPRDW